MAFRNEPDSEKVIFLYKFIEGDCPKSFGMNVARLAGIPEDVLLKAKHKSNKFALELDKLAARVQHLKK